MIFDPPPPFSSGDGAHPARACPAPPPRGAAVGARSLPPHLAPCANLFALCARQRPVEGTPHTWLLQCNLTSPSHRASCARVNGLRPPSLQSKPVAATKDWGEQGLVPARQSPHWASWFPGRRRCRLHGGPRRRRSSVGIQLPLRCSSAAGPSQRWARGLRRRHGTTRGHLLTTGKGTLKSSHGGDWFGGISMRQAMSHCAVSHQ